MIFFFSTHGLFVGILKLVFLSSWSFNIIRQILKYRICSYFDSTVGIQVLIARAGIHLNQEQTIVQYSNVSTIPNLNFLGYSGDLNSELVGIRIVENSLFVKWFLIQTTI